MTVPPVIVNWFIEAGHKDCAIRTVNDGDLSAYTLLFKSACTIIIIAIIIIMRFGW